MSQDPHWTIDQERALRARVWQWIFAGCMVFWSTMAILGWWLT